jgi:hypothetical protein
VAFFPNPFDELGILFGHFASDEEGRAHVVFSEDVQDDLDRILDVIDGIIDGGFEQRCGVPMLQIKCERISFRRFIETSHD